MEPTRQANLPQNGSILGRSFGYLISRPIDSAVIWLLLGALPSWLSVYLIRSTNVQGSFVGMAVLLVAFAIMMFFPLFPIVFAAQTSRSDQYPGFGGTFVMFFRNLGRYILILLLLLLRVVLIGLVAILVGVGIIGLLTLIHHAMSASVLKAVNTVVTFVSVIVSCYLVLRRRVWAYYLGVIVNLKPRAAMKASVDVAHKSRRFTELAVLLGIVSTTLL